MDKDTKFPNLSNAPISEALIDIQVRFKEPPPKGILLSVADLISEEFPLKDEQQVTTFNFELSSTGSNSSSEQETPGFLMRTEDELYAAQIKCDRFTFSRLTPYVDWNDLRKKTDKIWAIYRDTTKPDRVVRIAVRYINRLLLEGGSDLNDYFKTTINIPDGLPQTFVEYMSRFVIPEPESQIVATVQQVFEGVTTNNQASIVFDIDAFKNVDLAADNEEKIWLYLENLHNYKNHIFFKCLTDKAIELYK